MADARVLFVCNANVCRSPLAQGLFCSATGANCRVSSAGVGAEPGLPMIPICQDLLAARGVATTGFRSRRLTADAVHRADAVITMTRAELREVLRVVPTAIRRTVTLVEIGRCATEQHTMLAGATVGDRLTALVSQAVGERGTRRADHREDDIPDPVGGDLAALDAVTETIIRTVDMLVAAILPGQPDGNRVSAIGTG